MEERFHQGSFLPTADNNVSTTAPAIETTAEPTEEPKKWFSNKAILVLGGCVLGVLVLIVVFVIYKMCVPDKEESNNVRTQGPKVRTSGLSRRAVVDIFVFLPVNILVSFCHLCR